MSVLCKNDFLESLGAGVSYQDCSLNIDLQPKLIYLSLLMTGCFIDDIERIHL